MIERGTALNKAGIPVIIILLLASCSFGSVSHQTDTAKPMNISDGGLQNSSWPMYCHDMKHTSRSPYSTANNPYVEKWRFQTINGGWIGTSMSISNDGTIYFAQSNHMFALFPNGTLKWTYPTWENTIASTPAIDASGTIYLGTWDCALWAFNPNGTVKWRIGGLGGSIGSSPAIGSDGTIYFGTLRAAGQIIAINQTGQRKWQYFTDSPITSSPAIGDDGTIYIGSEDKNLYAMYPNGTLRWKFQTGDTIDSDPSIASDGTIYITSADGYLYALSPNGTQRWKTLVGWGSISASPIATDGTIYVAGDQLYAVYPNGTMRWTFSLGLDRWVGRCSPAISADGTIYVGAIIGDGHGGEIIAVNPNGTQRWRKIIAEDGIHNSLAIGSDGIIYATAENYLSGELVAIGRGPIIVNAHGPYSGYYQQPIQFTGTTYGGIPPYSYHWDFGDGQTSTVQNPTHTYSSVGNFTATFTVTDSEGNSSSDTAMVTINYKAPSVSITKPANGFYIGDTRILPIRKCIIIGQITIVANASGPLGITRVEFSIDGKLKATDTEAPYSWIWTTLSFSKHTITVTAYDNSGKSVKSSISVFKLF